MDIMRNKKRLRDFEIYENVFFINDDLTILRNKLVMELKRDDNIKQVWTIEGRIFCIQMDQGREVKRVVDSPENLFKVGWSEGIKGIVEILEDIAYFSGPQGTRWMASRLRAY